MQYKKIAYVTGSKIAENLDLSKVTHVNYAFGWVKDDEKGTLRTAVYESLE